RAGNQAMIAYCEARQIPVYRCGKLVVAKDASELAQLDELLQRGAANKVPLEDLTEKEATAIEPRVKTYQRALFSPSTASASPQRVIDALMRDALDEGISIHT